MTFITKAKRYNDVPPCLLMKYSGKKRLYYAACCMLIIIGMQLQKAKTELLYDAFIRRDALHLPGCFHERLHRQFYLFKPPESLKPYQVLLWYSHLQMRENRHPISDKLLFWNRL